VQSVTSTAKKAFENEAFVLQQGVQTERDAPTGSQIRQPYKIYTSWTEKEDRKRNHRQRSQCNTNLLCKK